MWQSAVRQVQGFLEWLHWIFGELDEILGVQHVVKGIVAGVDEIVLWRDGVTCEFGEGGLVSAEFGVGECVWPAVCSRLRRGEGGAVWV